MKYLFFVGLLSLMAFVGCQNETTKPVGASDTKTNTKATSTLTPSDNQSHTTMKPVVTEAKHDQATTSATHNSLATGTSVAKPAVSASAVSSPAVATPDASNSTSTPKK